MVNRLRTLLRRESEGEITLAEKAELDEYERLEHLIVMIKSGNLQHPTGRDLATTYVPAALRREVIERGGTAASTVCSRPRSPSSQTKWIT